MMIAAALLVFAAAYLSVSRANFRHNSRIDALPDKSTRGKLVNSQNGAAGELFRFGLYSARRNACEAIAVHNVRVLSGLPSCLSESVRDVQRSFGMIGLGFFGTSPYAVGRILRKYGLDCRRVKLSDIGQDGICILSYWTKARFFSPIHTVAIKKAASRLTAYNLTGNGAPSHALPEDIAARSVCVWCIKST